MTKSKKLGIFLAGLIKENPVLVLVLGTCPTLAQTTSIINALSTETTGTILSLNKSAVQKAFGTTNLDSSTEWTTLKNLKSNWTITLI